MKYTIEFRDGLRYIEKEIEGTLPRVGDSILTDNAMYEITGVLIDIRYSEPIYRVKLKLMLEANFED